MTFRLPLVVPQICDGIVRSKCRELSEAEPQLVAVVAYENSKPLQCYFNVQAAAQDGLGQPLFGWLIWLFPNIWIEAHHHAVIMRTDGSLCDVTPPKDGEKQIVFLPDSSTPFDYTNPKPVRKRVQCISTLQEIEEWRRALIAKEKFEWHRSRFVGQQIETRINGDHDLRHYERLKLQLGTAERNAHRVIIKQ